ADQVHLGRVHVQRAIDLQVVCPGGAAGLGRVADVGVELVRLAPVLPGFDVAGRELVQGDAERGQVTGGDEVPGGEGVQVGHGVGEAAAFHHQPVGLVPEQAAEADRDQHAHQRHVEQQVADLAAV